MHLMRAIQQLTNLFNAIDNTHKQTTTQQSNATRINNEMNNIIQTHERNKRNIINPMLRCIRK